MKNNLKYRQFLPESRRVVVKIGTRVIAQRTGRPDKRRLLALVGQVAAARRIGIEVVVVTSGAVGAGMEALGIRERPIIVSDLQMCAAVGQARLMALYTQLFLDYKIRIGQVLLTHDDFDHRVRNANAKRTLEHLLRAGVVPIVNENDVVADEELKAEFSFGDNDFLAALVVKLIRADLLVILSTVEGVLRPDGNSRRRIPCIDKIGPDIFKLVNPGATALSKGGMDSKLRSAQIAAKAGCSVVIGHGCKQNTLTDILAGKDVGTMILGATL
jgi:glutamate 5-kinase